MKTIIHIGLGKCLSTSLQHCWKRSNNYNCIHIENYSKKLNSILKNRNFNKAYLLRQSKEIFRAENIQFSKQNTNIITFEGLTFSFLGEPKLIDLIPIKWEIVVKTMRDAASDGLLVVRDPVDWVKSAYAQYIKQGGVLTFFDFITFNDDIICANLDLASIKEIFEKNGVRIKILPLEAYKFNKNLFWDQYEKILELERPKPSDLPTGAAQGNVTSYESLEIHRRINLILGYLENIYVSNNSFYKSQAGAMSETINLVRRWGSRRAIEHATEKELTDLKKILNCTNNAELQITELPKALLKSINENFLSTLQGCHFPFPEILSGYTESLSQANASR